MRLARPWRTLARVGVLVVMFALLSGARHRVRDGETFASVADAYGVKEKSLRLANPHITKLDAGQVIIIPEMPPQQKWSPAHPYAPPKPTVTQLEHEMSVGTVDVAEHETKPGTYVMFAGKNQDIEIGELRRRKVGKAVVYDVYLHPATGQTARDERKRPPPLVKLGRSTEFRPPEATNDEPLTPLHRPVCPP